MVSSGDLRHHYHVGEDVKLDIRVMRFPDIMKNLVISLEVMINDSEPPYSFQDLPWTQYRVAGRHAGFRYGSRSLLLLLFEDLQSEHCSFDRDLQNPLKSSCRL